MLTNQQNLLEEMVSRDNIFFDISKLEAELVQILRQEEASIWNINIAKGIRTTDPRVDCFNQIFWFGLVGLFVRFGLVGLFGRLV